MLKTDIFCDEGRINVKIHSCGTVYVMHWPYSAGEKTGNRFLLSYYGKVMVAPWPKCNTFSLMNRKDPGVIQATR